MVDLFHPNYPRSSGYDAAWLVSLDMGPNPLWLLEDLLSDVTIPAGAKVLDLGSGRGATSVFLARELSDAQVWSVDLWIGEAEANATFEAADVVDRVTAVQVDARALPFDSDHFDAIISIDAWEYFGTDDHFLPSLLRVLRPGGQLAVSTPAMSTDPRDLETIPDHIADVVGWEAMAWHSPEWWVQQWTMTGLVDNVRARPHPTGWADWKRWAQAVAPDGADPVRQMLAADGGDLLGFAQLFATRKLNL